MSGKYPFKASIIIPTRHRSQLLESRLATLKQNTPEIIDGTAEVIIVSDFDDLVTYNMIQGTGFVQLQVEPLTIPSIKWNRASQIAKGEWLVTISDDCIPEPYWLTHALDSLNHGFLGLPDGVTGDRNRYFTPLYMATREWLRKYNGGVLVIPVYKSWYADIETCQRAHRSRTYIVSGRSVVTQLHAIFNTAPDDEIYKLGESRRAEDLQTYNLRSSKGFPDDFERCL
jgi:hypothetical protein